MKFVPRTTAPSSTNKYYLKAGKGGYNRAMEINKTTHSCLSNCTGWVHGRFLESQQQTDYAKYDKLCVGNAKSYWNKKDGYKRGQTPKVGAVGCYSGGKSGSGHVLFVEEVKPNGDIVTSNSAYGGTRFFLKTLKKSNNYKYSSIHNFQGFIYNPTEFTESDVTPTVERDEAKDQLEVLTDDLRVREDPSTDAIKIGVVEKGKIYNYYEVYNDKEYTWYRIADNQWIANNGSWLKIYPKKESNEEQMKELIEKLEKENLELKQKNSILEQELEDSINNQKDYKCVYKCLKSGNYDIKIYLKENESLYVK